MPTSVELIDPAQAQRYLLETWVQACAGKLTAYRLTAALRVALELANEGQPVTHLGFISDCIDALTPARPVPEQEDSVLTNSPSLSPSLVRRYEDYVLGKFSADLTLQRTADELAKYSDRDLDRAIAFAIQHIQSRAELPGFIIATSILKDLLAKSVSKLRNELDELLGQPISPQAIQLYEGVIQGIRNCGDLLGAEDIFELASGTALSAYSQRIALRQVLQAVQYMCADLTRQKPTGLKRHYSVATNIMEEDLYPVGGFSSIANRGTMESLLRSELAYMEIDERPDLFDIKYARDELLYYSRDDNQFYRRRVTVMLVLDHSLVRTRVKDADAPWQRIVLTMATVVSIVNTLTDWLASDALAFDVVLPNMDAGLSLAQESELLQMTLHQEIGAGHVSLMTLSESELASRTEANVRKSLCWLVRIHAEPESVDETATSDAQSSVWQPLTSELSVADPLPRVTFDQATHTFEETNHPWRASLRTLLLSGPL